MVKCIEAGTTQAKLAANIGITTPYINRLVRKCEAVINKTFVKMMEKVGYDIEVNCNKRKDIDKYSIKRISGGLSE